MFNDGIMEQTQLRRSHFNCLLECRGNFGSNVGKVGSHQAVEQGVTLLVNHPNYLKWLQSMKKIRFQSESDSESESEPQ